MKKTYLRALFLIVWLLLIPLAGNFAGMEAQAASGEKPDNMEYTFASINGWEVSTKTEMGKVTVLVFGYTTCGNSQATIRNIAKSDWVSSAGIRVVFAEANKASQEAVKNFAATYGNEHILFCYDGGSSIWDAAFEYYDLGVLNEGAGAGFPFTVLIDGNNKVQKVLTEYQSADGIMKEIRAFAGGNYEETNPKVNVDISGTENYSYANEVLALVNQERARRGLGALKQDQALTEVAMQRAAELAMYYSHTRPDGTKCFTATDRGTRRAENIAVGYPSPQAVMAAWISSPGHLANITDSEMTSIGIGCFQDSGGIWHWVQFFDNAQASETSLSGTRQVTRGISIRKSLLHLQPVANQAFVCKDKGTAVSMDIYHANELFEASKPKLAASGFDFVSSNPAAATVDAGGMITVQGPGTAVITASVKGDASCAVTKTVTVADHVYVASKVEPTYTEEGYTLHTCSVCGDSYKDSIVPKLEQPQNSEKDISDVTGLKASSGATSIKLSWKKVSGAEGYRIYQYSGKKWEKLATVTSGRTSCTVKKLRSATGYRFAVKAYRTVNKKQVFSKSYTSLYTATNPADVKFKVTAGKKKAAVKWDKVPRADKYIVSYKTGTKGSWKNLKTTKSLRYTRKNLKSGKTYTFAVRACKVYRGKTYTSSYQGKKIKIK